MYSGRAKELGLYVLSPDNHTIIWSFKISHNSPTSRWSSIEVQSLVYLLIYMLIGSLTYLLT